MTDVVNPMLEDDDETSTDIANPMLEDDGVEEVVALSGRFAGLKLAQPDPVAPTKVAEKPVAKTPVTQPTKKKPHRLGGPVVKPENIGKPGYDKLGRKITGSPRRRLTEKDGLILAFLAKTRVAYDQDLAELFMAEPTPMKPVSSVLSTKTMSERLKRLRAMGYVETSRDKRGGTIWGTNSSGVAAARNFGHLQLEEEEHGASFKQIGWSVSDHFLMISRVAARFASPMGYFEDSLGVGPVPLSSMLNEHQLNSAWARGTQEILNLKKEGKETDYPGFRDARLSKALAEVQAGRLSWSNMIEANPLLWTLGDYGDSDKQKLEPDLVIDMEADRTTGSSRSILVEVELTKKPWDVYETRLASFARELSTLSVYGQIVYFVPGRADGKPDKIEQVLRDVDRYKDYGLFESNRFKVLPLFNRDGSAIRLGAGRKLGE
ncbi:hypothetical protein [Microbacterium sp. KR10-403]|uniref:hypothetical protein n=1 Tax=Microbacterium sp. KR10-403 TaxID=3158581 RepID=UPI0032E4FB73